MVKPSRKLKKIFLIAGITGAVYAGFQYLLPLVIPFLIAYMIALGLKPSAHWLRQKLSLTFRGGPTACRWGRWGEGRWPSWRLFLAGWPAGDSAGWAERRPCCRRGSPGGSAFWMRGSRENAAARSCFSAFGGMCWWICQGHGGTAEPGCEGGGHAHAALDCSCAPSGFLAVILSLEEMEDLRRRRGQLHVPAGVRPS